MLKYTFLKGFQAVSHLYLPAQTQKYKWQSSAFRWQGFIRPEDQPKDRIKRHVKYVSTIWNSEVLSLSDRRNLNNMSIQNYVNFGCFGTRGPWWVVQFGYRTNILMIPLCRRCLEGKIRKLICRASWTLYSGVWSTFCARSGLRMCR